MMREENTRFRSVPGAGMLRLMPEGMAMAMGMCMGMRMMCRWPARRDRTGSRRE